MVPLLPPFLYGPVHKWYYMKIEISNQIYPPIISEIPGKILGMSKIDRTEKFWYLLLRPFQLLFLKNWHWIMRPSKLKTFLMFTNFVYKTVVTFHKVMTRIVDLLEG